MYIETFFNTFIQKLNEKDLRIEVETLTARPIGSCEFKTFNIVNKDSSKRWMKNYVYLKFKALRKSPTSPIEFDLIVDYPKLSGLQIPVKDLNALYEYRDKLLYFVTLLNEAELSSSCMFDCSLINALEHGYKKNKMRLLNTIVVYKR